MARYAQNIIADVLYHIINRGKQAVLTLLFTFLIYGVSYLFPLIFQFPCRLSCAQGIDTLHSVPANAKAADISASTHFTWNKDISENYPLAKQIRYTLSIQNLENKPGEKVKLWMYAPVTITSHQALKKLKTTYPAKVSQDGQGNIICEFSLQKWLSFQ